MLHFPPVDLSILLETVGFRDREQTSISSNCNPGEHLCLQIEAYEFELYSLDTFTRTIRQQKRWCSYTSSMYKGISEKQIFFFLSDMMINPEVSRYKFWESLKFALLSLLS